MRVYGARVSAKSPDVIPMVVWRETAETVGDMLARGWDVISTCQTCGLQMQASLRLIARISGPGVSLWNRREPCRRLFCPGSARFLGRPPGAHRHRPLDAEWPAGRT